jgi:hypothetical protein
VLVSDIHLRHLPPIFRSVEKNWYATQKGYLDQLIALTRAYRPEPTLPVICAGDIFHKWNSPAQLINFAIDHMPHVYAVPGQHDLPFHNYGEIEKSAYWTLVQAGKITNLSAEAPIEITGAGSVLRLHGFAWGRPISDLAAPHDLLVEVAVIHAFIWTKTTGYPTAPPEQRLKPFKRKLRGYDVALFGDNHKTIFWNINRDADTVTILNPGSFMKQTTDQRDHVPCVGILHSDGSIEPHYLDVTGDKFLLPDEFNKLTIGEESLSQFIGQLMKLQSDSVNFEAVVKQRLEERKASPKVKRIVLAALEGG